ncbi:IRE1 [[Candida] subhashii]|uniref:non-specific serine/threonine protein kinase n=1 Tax=[Candida] subhashii TaxID=561895 RepID=A0A8J5QGV9_9ASCO|nr:IRE1 [[Candida] subhashii]KAG7661155.1 IRE1 [[Candida] subhashii]
MQLLLPLVSAFILLISIAYSSPRLERLTTETRNYLTAQNIYNHQQHALQSESVDVNQPTITEPRLSPSIAPLDYRSIADCKLTDLLLISDIDGNLHGVERNSGLLIWTLPIDEPLVKIRTNTTQSQENSQATNILWFVEPYQDGSLYYFTPKFGLNKLPTSIKDLVMESPFSLSGDDKIYTGTRRTSLYTINIHTGEIKSSFGNDEKCPIPNSVPASPWNGQYKPDDTVMVGKTTYELSIHSKTNSNIVWNVTYSQWVPNNIDNDLIMQNQQSLDKLYFTPFHDRSLLAINQDVGTPIWISKLPALAVNVFDVFNNGKNNEYVLLPHPLKVLNGLQHQEHDANSNGLVFINKTSNCQEWIAMSFTNYPTLIKSAPISNYQTIINNYYRGLSDQLHFIENFHLAKYPEDQVERLVTGIHRVFELSSDTSYQPMPRFTTSNIKRIGDGRPHSPEEQQPPVDANIADQIPNIMDGIKFPAKIPTGSDIIFLEPINDHEYETSGIEPPPPPAPNTITTSARFARRIFEDLAVLLVVFVLLMTFGKSNKFIRRMFGEYRVEQKNDQESGTVEEIKQEIGITKQKTNIGKNGTVNEIVEEKLIMSKFADEDVSEKTVSASSDSSNEDKSTVDDPSPKKKVVIVEPESTEHKEGDENDDIDTDAPVTKKKRKRGSRGGKRGGRRINKNKSDGDGRDDDNDDEDVEEIIREDEEVVISTKSLLKVNPVPPKSKKKLQIENNLVISDKILGYGSHGTVVFEGTFENRPVAVKRMLLDFFDVASHEVRLLQESDDHPNVVRYFCSQSSESEKFLYIALELCLCTLEDIVEKKQPMLRIPRKNDILYQLASGLHYLHSLKIVHRDIKPQNILVADAKRKKHHHHKQNGSTQHQEENNVRLLISDFGLCKKLDNDQSSFRATTQHAASGTSGWRAPELLLHHDLSEISPDSISSVHSQNGTSHPSSSSSSGKRLTKAIDIFSLGCVFYYILTGGSHPFGDRYLREGNIIKGEYDLRQLLEKCPNDKYESTDLISSLISANPSLRPNTSKILKHPLFWENHKRLEFLLKVSDRFEIERRDPPSELLLKLEARGYKIHHGNWHRKFDQEFLDNLGKYRRYNPDKLMDLLRAMRNKYHHFNDMPESLQAKMRPLPDGFYKYFNDKFPRLLMEVYYCVEENLKDEHVFTEYYV